MVEKKVNDFIRCPRCELNFIHKKDKLCSVCKKELEAAFLHGEDVDADLGLDFDICPICKTNYIREDEDMCAACQKERDLDKIVTGDNDEEESPASDDWTNEEEDTDGVLPDDELGHMVGITDTDEEELDALDLEDLGDFDDEDVEEAEDVEDEEADEDEAEEPEEDELEEDFDEDLDDLDDLDDDDDLDEEDDDLDDDEK